MRLQSNRQTSRASSFVLLGLASLLACFNAAASEPGCWSSQVLSPIAPGNYWDHSNDGIPTTTTVEVDDGPVVDLMLEYATKMLRSHIQLGAKKAA